MAQKQLFFVYVMAAPNVASCRGIDATAVGVGNGVPPCFEVGSRFAETGSPRLLVVGEPLRSVPSLLRPCLTQGVCVGSAQSIRNLQGTLRTGVVDGCRRSRTHTPSCQQHESLRHVLSFLPLLQCWCEVSFTLLFCSEKGRCNAWLSHVVPSVTPMFG